MGLTDFISIIGVLAGFLIAYMGRLDDNVSSLLHTVLLQKTSILSNYIDKLENKMRGQDDIEYSEDIHKHFIEQVSISIEDGARISLLRQKYEKLKLHMFITSIAILAFCVLKFMLNEIVEYCNIQITFEYIKFFNIFIIHLYPLWSLLCLENKIKSQKV